MLLKCYLADVYSLLAIRTLNGYCPDGVSNPMSVKFADPNYFEIKNTAIAHTPKMRGGRWGAYGWHISPYSHIPQPPRSAFYIFDVSNLPAYASVCHLYNTFFSYGHILAVHIDPFWTGSSVVCSGTGGISLHTTSDFAAKILTDLDGAIVFGPLHPIGVGALCVPLNV